MSALEPGLYRATVRGVADQIVMRVVGAWTEASWMSQTRINDARWHDDAQITDARPLIVLDLEDPAEVVRHLRSAHSEWVCLDDMADAIEAQTKPARIPEPGLWGVVEATSAPYSNYRTQYVYRGGTADPVVHWARCMDGDLFGWDDLIDPTLIREGVAE